MMTIHWRHRFCQGLLEGIARNVSGYKPSRGFAAPPEGEKECKELFVKLGSLDYKDQVEVRKNSANRWRSILLDSFKLE
jgi:hypothetical protein